MMNSLIDVIPEFSSDTLYSIYHINTSNEIFGIKFEPKKNISQLVFNELKSLSLMDENEELTDNFVKIKKLIDNYNTNPIRISIGNIFVTKSVESDDVTVLLKTSNNKYKLLLCDSKYLIHLIVRFYNTFFTLKNEDFSLPIPDEDMEEINNTTNINPNDVLSIFKYEDGLKKKYNFYKRQDKLIMIDEKGKYSYVDRIFIILVLFTILDMEVDENKLRKSGEQICKQVIQ